VPPDHGFWFHDDEGISPAGPETPKVRPEQSVDATEPWPRSFSFEHGDLLTEGEDLKSGIRPASEENANNGEDGKKGFNHRTKVLTEGRLAITSQSQKTQITDCAGLSDFVYLQVYERAIRDFNQLELLHQFRVELRREPTAVRPAYINFFPS
jgi:hypothetical protein